MMLDKYEKSLLCMEIAKIAKQYGINSKTMSSILTEAIRETEDESELALFCIAVNECAGKNGIDYDVITTLLAEAIKNRERELSATDISQTERKSAKFSETKEYRGPQLVYGPPPVKEEYEVREMPQPLYGPPPVREVHEVGGPRL